MTSVLLVEDEVVVADPLAAALRHEAYLVDVRSTAAAALEAMETNSYDLVVLDLGLPDTDGLHACREIRRLRPDVPILILTARVSEIDVVVGLDAGADDYVSKPFRLAELMARMRALLRRGAVPADITVGDLRVEPAARRAWIDEASLELSTKEFDLLALLAASAGSVVNRDRISREVWGGQMPGSSRTIDAHVSALRRKLTVDHGTPIAVITAVRGVGFRLQAA